LRRCNRIHYHIRAAVGNVQGIVQGKHPEFVVLFIHHQVGDLEHRDVANDSLPLRVHDCYVTRAPAIAVHTVRSGVVYHEASLGEVP
jgi:predicted metal-dependent hydrolase